MSNHDAPYRLNDQPLKSPYHTWVQSKASIGQFLTQ